MAANSHDRYFIGNKDSAMKDGFDLKGDDFFDAEVNRLQLFEGIEHEQSRSFFEDFDSSLTFNVSESSLPRAASPTHKPFSSEKCVHDEVWGWDASKIQWKAAPSKTTNSHAQRAAYQTNIVSPLPQREPTATFTVPHSQRSSSPEGRNAGRATSGTRLADHRLPVLDQANKSDGDGDLSDCDMSLPGANPLRFRPYQEGKWFAMYDALCDFRRRHGHCLVKQNFPEYPALAHWVKRQRYKYRLMVQGKTSSMTQERKEALDRIGFVWNSQEAGWYERFQELVEFKKVHGHCNVPSHFVKNRSLVCWVKHQRRQYRLLQLGQTSSMTKARIVALEQLGFEWSSSGGGGGSSYKTKCLRSSAPCAA